MIIVLKQDAKTEDVTRIEKTIEEIPIKKLQTLCTLIKKEIV